jgi:hypothetical protein
LEVDFLVPTRGRKLVFLEAKAARTVYPEAARSLRNLAESADAMNPECIVVHMPKAADAGGTALAPGVRAMSVREMLEALRG